MVQHSTQLDQSFGALAHPTRRGIIEQLGTHDCSIGELADFFGMSLTGVKKHVCLLEQAGLVTTEKVGRVRLCRLGQRRLEHERAWIDNYGVMVEQRLDRLGSLLEVTRR